MPFINQPDLTRLTTPARLRPAVVNFASGNASSVEVVLSNVTQSDISSVPRNPNTVLPIGPFTALPAVPLVGSLAVDTINEAYTLGPGTYALQAVLRFFNGAGPRGTLATRVQTSDDVTLVRDFTQGYCRNSQGSNSDNVNISKIIILDRLTTFQIEVANVSDSRIRIDTGSSRVFIKQL